MGKQASLRVVSLNAFGPPVLSRNISERFSAISAALRQENPSVICLQEVFLYPHLHLLRSLLNDYPVMLYKRFLYGPRGGLVIFAKYPLTHGRFINFSKRGSLKNKSLVARIIRNGILTCRLGDGQVTLANTHLTPNTDIDWSEENRFSPFLKAQLEEIANFVRREKQLGREVVLTGDFNIPPDSFLYREFLNESRLTDIFSDNRAPTYHESYLPAGKRAQQIDYIFVSRPSDALASDYFLEQPLKQNGRAIYLSDHVGILADLLITERPKND